MRYSLLLVAALIFFGVFELAAQKVNPSSSKSISLHLPEGVNSEGLQIIYSISGSFGGFGGFVRIEENIQRYEIPLVHEGKPVENLSLIVFSPNYQLQVFDFPSLAGMQKNIKLKFEPLETVPFVGRILLPDQFDAEDLQIKVSYLPVWKCEFFGLKDCLLGHLPITSVNLEKDGSFKVNLPDFARDPTISSFKDKGEFTFAVVDKSGKSLFGLKLKDDSKGFGRVKTALNYTIEMVFIPEKLVINEENSIHSSKTMVILGDLAREILLKLKFLWLA
ncbi:MAG TPA: hypothetical protein VK892_00430 [Pyrinomonadaceae bacterium]|nr:hypothetical protein [Pyrinomonadaceae bacterium]